MALKSFTLHTLNPCFFFLLKPLNGKCTIVYVCQNFNLENPFESHELKNPFSTKKTLYNF